MEGALSATLNPLGMEDQIIFFFFRAVLHMGRGVFPIAGCAVLRVVFCFRYACFLLFSFSSVYFLIPSCSSFSHAFSLSLSLRSLLCILSFWCAIVLGSAVSRFLSTPLFPLKKNRFAEELLLLFVVPSSSIALYLFLCIRPPKPKSPRKRGTLTAHLFFCL